MEIIFRRSCTADLQWFRRYYQSVFPDGQLAAKAHFQKAYDALRLNPEIGHPAHETLPVRELVIARTPFSFLYYIDRDRIVVIRVLDNRGERPGDFQV